MFVLKKERINKLNELEQKLNVSFADKKLLSQSLTHSSFLGVDTAAKDNQRLEFLGDSVLSLFIAEYLYVHFQDHNEGKLTKLKNYLVSEPVLHKAAQQVFLGEYLLLSPSEDYNGGRNKAAALADALEAFIGALYLDQGKEIAFKFIETYLLGSIPEEIFEDNFVTDFKSEVQYLVQKKYKICPDYNIIEDNGPNHNKIFLAQFFINEKFYAEGSGKSKKIAEQEAAKIVWEGIKEGTITL